MSTIKVINAVHPSSSTTNIVNDNAGNVTVGNNLSVSNTLNVTGNVTFSNTMVVTGNVTFSNSVTVAASGIVFSDSTTQTTAARLVQGTALAYTAATNGGTTLDFTSIPSWVKRITILFNEISTSGTSGSVVQLGTASGFVSSGYVSTSVGIAPAPGSTSYTNGFGIRNDYASYLLSGQMVITNISGNIWIESHYGKVSTVVGVCGGGSISLAAALTQIRITTVNGTDTFDAGSVNIMYE